jgi:hypothetical protein
VLKCRMMLNSLFPPRHAAVEMTGHLNYHDHELQ